MSNSNRRRLSASGIKNDSQFLSRSIICSLNHMNTMDSFLPDSDEGNESANTTNISDEANDGFRFTNDKLKSCGLSDWKVFEDSLDCDGDLMGWCREMRSGQMEALLHQRLILKAQEEENQQQKACLALMKAQQEGERSDSQAEITALREENEQLRTALLKTQDEVSRIQAQLDKLKQEFMDQQGVCRAEDKKDCISPKRKSSRRRDRIPGCYMPTQRRILFLNSGLSDSESALDPMSWDDVSESDREAPLESGPDTTEVQTTLETVESPCSGSNVLCQRKTQSVPPIKVPECCLCCSWQGGWFDTCGPPPATYPCGRMLSCEEERSEPTYRLVLAGDVGSGKSSFLLRLSQHQFRENMRSTVGVDCQMKRMLVDGKKMALQIWDTAGQERFHSISRSYFRKANGILLLYDITSEKSFLNITQWLEQIEACTTTSVPLCLVGNKADLRGNVPNSVCVSSACGMRLASTCGALFFETSAKEGTNVVEAVLHLAREVKKAGGVLTDSTLQLSGLRERDSLAGNCCWGLA